MIYKLLSIVVTHVAIAAIQFVANRIVKLGYLGRMGIYLMLLPVGFSCFGWEIPQLFEASMVVGGLLVLLWGVAGQHKSSIGHKSGTP